jgi:hypothetical protein
MSNFLEHFPSYREVIDVLASAFAKLKPGGSVLILQPSYRLQPVRYFDAIDHTVVLSDRNLLLVLRGLSFQIDELRVRFLPFTSKSRVPKSPWLVAVSSPEAVAVAARRADPHPRGTAREARVAARMTCR